MKNKILSAVNLAILTLSVMIGLGSVVSATTLRVVQTPTIHLYTGQSGSATTMRITPYPKDLDGTKLTITDFGTSPTLTVDPKYAGIEEIESFTTITDNGDGTATLSGMSRNLTSKYPYTTAGTGRTHGSGATVVFGNNPQIYGRLAAPENIQTWTAIQTFSSSTMPRYDAEPSAAMYAAATGLELVDLNKLAATALAGATNASQTASGIVQIATFLQQASSTSLGSSGARLVLAASNATSTCGYATSSVLTLQANGKVQQACLNLVESWALSGGLWSSASTTIAASDTTTHALTLNGIPYKYPGSQSASSSVLATNGSGSLSWLVIPTIFQRVQTANTSVNGATTSLKTIAIPANTLSANSMLRFTGFFAGKNSGGLNCYFGVNYGIGTAATTAVGFVAEENTYGIGQIVLTIMPTSTTAGMSFSNGTTQVLSGLPVQHPAAANLHDISQYLPYPVTSQTYLEIEAYTNGGVCTFNGGLVEVL